MVGLGRHEADPLGEAELVDEGVDAADLALARPAPLAPPTTTSTASGRRSAARARTATSRPFSGWMRPTNSSTGSAPEAEGAAGRRRRSPGAKKACSTPGATISTRPGGSP